MGEDAVCYDNTFGFGLGLGFEKGISLFLKLTYDGFVVSKGTFFFVLLLVVNDGRYRLIPISLGCDAFRTG